MGKISLDRKISLDLYYSKMYIKINQLSGVFEGGNLHTKKVKPSRKKRRFFIL